MPNSTLKAADVRPHPLFFLLRAPRTLTELLVAFGREILRLDGSFRFTSIQANKDYGARLHTDKNNLGPSYIIG